MTWAHQAGSTHRRRRMDFGDTDPSAWRGDEHRMHVAAGEWRDYAIDFLKDRAVFSVFRRASEVPIYRIEKNPKLGRRQGAYSVISATGHILRRGQELDRVLGALDRSLRIVVG